MAGPDECCMFIHPAEPAMRTLGILSEYIEWKLPESLQQLFRNLYKIPVLYGLCTDDLKF